MMGSWDDDVKGAAGHAPRRRPAMSFTGEPRHCVEPVSHDASGAPARTMGRVGGRLQSQWQAELAKRREAETSRLVTMLHPAMRRRET